MTNGSLPNKQVVAKPNPYTSDRRPISPFLRNLLQRHVTGVPKRATRHREPIVGFNRLASPKSDTFGAVGRQKYSRASNRDESRPVQRGGNRVGDCADQSNGFGHWHRCIGIERFERSARHVLHREVRVGGGRTPARDDVRMIEDARSMRNRSIASGLPG